LADLQRTVYPHKWSPVSRRSSAGQRKFASLRLTFYHCSMQPTVWHIYECHKLSPHYMHKFHMGGCFSWGKKHMDTGGVGVGCYIAAADAAAAAYCYVAMASASMNFRGGSFHTSVTPLVAVALQPLHPLCSCCIFSVANTAPTNKVSQNNYDTMIQQILKSHQTEVLS